MNKEGTILSINAGSSSIRFALYPGRVELNSILSGKIERIGLPDASFIVIQGKQHTRKAIGASGFDAAIRLLNEWFREQEWFQGLVAIGHRIVLGMQHAKPEIVTDELLRELEGIVAYDPDHLPAEIAIVRQLKQSRPDLVQVACFDTAFHTTIPAVAKTFAIPKKYFGEGIRRYGFHGISYRYLMQRLEAENVTEARKKIILAHLGNGASLAAVKEGKCIDTTMGFTPAGGIVMSTRSGDLDPGIAAYLVQQGMSPKDFNDLINHQSGLLGISGRSADMADLLQAEKDDQDAALAIDIFCYQIIKSIGAYIAVLGGLDALVFSGGIGENAPVIRLRICDAFKHAGLEIAGKRNEKSDRLISSDSSKIKVLVIPTDEELLIARDTADLCERPSANHKIG